MRALPASDPEEGSVNPHAPMNSPVASFGRYFFFCASFPARKMWFEHSDVCAATMIPNRPIHPRKLFDGGDVLHVPHPRAAQLRRKDDAHQPQLAQFFDGRQRKIARLVPLADVRRDLALGKFAHALLELQLFFVELEVQRGSPTGEGLLHHSGEEGRNALTDRLVKPACCLSQRFSSPSTAAPQTHARDWSKTPAYSLRSNAPARPAQTPPESAATQ